uniref:Uncharacterized protein n=1 Tax=Mycena chlorophos TaxID=658473 RepID=A0ABQ0LA38_MYCCL|nr:predicted protein [Mycena chlorophos]
MSPTRFAGAPEHVPLEFQRLQRRSSSLRPFLPFHVTTYLSTAVQPNRNRPVSTSRPNTPQLSSSPARLGERHVLGPDRHQRSMASAIRVAGQPPTTTRRRPTVPEREDPIRVRSWPVLWPGTGFDAGGLDTQAQNPTLLRRRDVGRVATSASVAVFVLTEGMPKEVRHDEHRRFLRRKR